MLLQNKAHYATYFGNHFEQLGALRTAKGSSSHFRYIHGIQMMPLSPALSLARTRQFNMLEWRLREYVSLRRSWNRNPVRCPSFFAAKLLNRNCIQSLDK